MGPGNRAQFPAGRDAKKPWLLPCHSGPETHGVSVSLTSTYSPDGLTSRWAWKAEALHGEVTPGAAGDVSPTPRQLHSREHIKYLP